ncbi:SMC domain protein [Solidesulfovibrio carbinoliphilus subsp. oakridgensis]|uniref:DNA repair protein RecN n=1 Tax=Solidesulfovibrio carbinoliphilus subsp. oakridgensis TaxID=694327 RepID=G7Q8C6_9BACT|nr:AAA family ATPase [Solidesulfovibrio carbinoliphilus]EHJ48538.1 SMC domain protein [Solidesulfovibrio carbinoliphilus subsp. oakridgensis]
MIEVLRIKNLALIDDLELEFGQGLNVLTGETGAGKSFIVSAVNFLTGEKMHPDLVRAGCEKAVVEALFVLDGQDLILRRELAAGTGRSRIYIGDGLASREALAALRPKLLLHASQHGQQRLLQPAFQAALLDGFLADDQPLAEKNRLLRELADIAGQIRALDAKAASLEEKRQFLEFQHAEISKVAPLPGEEDELIGRRAALAESRKASEALARALDTLEQSPKVLDTLADLHRELLHAGELFPDFTADAEAVAAFRHHLKDVAVRLRRKPTKAPGDDAEAIEKRLFELAQLRRKLRKSLAEIVDLGAEIEANLNFLDACALDRMRLAREEAERAEALAAALLALGRVRREAATRLSASLEEILRSLGFSKDVKVIFDFVPAEVYAPVAAELPALAEDRARILWRPNPGQPPQPLDKIASGGELSRFLLALMSLSAEPGGPTLIFDEIDAGIGGLTLGSVGAYVKKLSETSQILLITHWPQLASLADRHFQVVKTVEDGQTSTRCLRLSGPDIAGELSRMAGGGATGQEMARRLLSGGA